MSKIILYRLSLYEENNGKWTLTLRMKENIKVVEFESLDAAMKEFNRALELRDMVNEAGIDLVKWVKQREKEDGTKK